MKDDPDLGRARVAEWQSGWKIKGTITVQQALDLRTHIINFVGMTQHEKPTLDKFSGEVGGVGFQLYQVLVESWLIIGTWYDFGFFRVNLSSCKEFNHNAITAELQIKFGQNSILKNYSTSL